jgi:hypothetical protein
MRNRRKTIESLRRLAERPGTKAEGETAKRLLESMTAGMPQPKPLNLADFPRGTEIWYAYWCYSNCRGTVRTKPPKIIQGRWWMLVKFDHLKQARWVPVESRKGCHISKTPFSPEQADYLYHTYRED